MEKSIVIKADFEKKIIPFALIKFNLNVENILSFILQSAKRVHTRDVRIIHFDQNLYSMKLF